MQFWFRPAGRAALRSKRKRSLCSGEWGKLVLVQGLNSRGGEIPRVEFVVAQKFGDVTVKIIGAGLGHHAGGGAARASIFSRGVGRQDAKFGVQQITVRFGVLAVHGISLVGAQQTPGRAKPPVRGATPGWSRPSCVKFRPFSGRSVASREEITFPNVEPRSTVAPVALTVTSVCPAATSSLTAIRTVLPILMRIAEA